MRYLWINVGYQYSDCCYKFGKFPRFLVAEPDNTLPQISVILHRAMAAQPSFKGDFAANLNDVLNQLLSRIESPSASSTEIEVLTRRMVWLCGVRRALESKTAAADVNFQEDLQLNTLLAQASTVLSNQQGPPVSREEHVP